MPASGRARLGWAALRNFPTPSRARRVHERGGPMNANALSGKERGCAWEDLGDDLLREPCKAIKDKTPPSFDGRVSLL